jgi:hypothetical protein
MVTTMTGMAKVMIGMAKAMTGTDNTACLP